MPNAVRLRAEISEMADELDLSVAFSRGRRRSDLLLVRVTGRRKQTLAVPAYLLQHQETLGIELIESRDLGGVVTLTVAITVPLEQQQPQYEERRGKLLRVDVLAPT